MSTEKQGNHVGTYTESLHDIWELQMSRLEALENLTLATLFEGNDSSDNSISMAEVFQATLKAVYYEMDAAIDCMHSKLGRVRFNRIGRSSEMLRKDTFLGVELIPPRKQPSPGPALAQQTLNDYPAQMEV